MKNLTDFRKTVETGVDPRLDLSLKLFPLPVLQLYKGGTRVNSLPCVFFFFFFFLCFFFSLFFFSFFLFVLDLDINPRFPVIIFSCC